MNEKYLNTYNDLILTFPKGGTKFLDSIFVITGALPLYGSIIKEIDKGIKFKYVIVKNPLEYFCSAFRNLYYPVKDLTTKEEIIIKMLSNKDAHYNLGLHSILYNLNTKYDIEHYVDITNLDNLLNEKMGILPFNTNKKDKTFPWYTNDMVIEELKSEHPDLWNIIESQINVEMYFYNQIRGMDKFYRVKKDII